MMLQILVVALMLLAACSPAEPGGSAAPAPAGPLRVSEALTSQSTEPVLVRGALVARQGEPVRLCEVLAESLPPQCAGASLVVEGLDLATVEGLQTAEGVTWGTAQLVGRVSDGVLIVDRTASA